MLGARPRGQVQGPHRFGHIGGMLGGMLLAWLYNSPKTARFSHLYDRAVFIGCGGLLAWGAYGIFTYVIEYMDYVQQMV